MPRPSGLLIVLASLLACLLFDPALAAAQRVHSDGADAHLAASQSEGGEESQEELGGGEEEAQVASNAENEEENEEEESEEGEANTASGHSAHRCVVPTLEGDSLSAARTALSRAHCKLGKISEPHLRHVVLVIVEQSKSSGKHLRGGAQIAVRLGASAKSHHHR
jgi:hypothetical protein